MRQRTLSILPQASQLLKIFGENIKFARLRRKLSMELVSERAGISRTTLTKIEKGDATVAMGYYFQVLFVLRLEKDFLKVAQDDILGRKLQDAELIVKKRAPKNSGV